MWLGRLARASREAAPPECSGETPKPRSMQRPRACARGLADQILWVAVNYFAASLDRLAAWSAAPAGALGLGAFVFAPAVPAASVSAAAPAPAPLLPAGACLCLAV